MLVMLVSLCSVIPVSASADAQVTTVTVASGDTVLSICQKLGVDYYTYKDLIMKLNGFTSEAAFNKIAVGTKLSLPISNAAAASLAGGTVSSTTGTATGGTTSSGLTTGTVTSLPSGDRVAYYLATYTVQSGETLGGIYSRWGLSYKTYANEIVKLNNLSSVNAIQAGKTLTLPTTNPSITGATYTTVMAHTMLAGENAYNIICSDYGLNYTAALSMLQALNNRTNMGAFRTGEILYIPVSGVVSANTNVSTGGTTTTTGTVNSTGAFNLVSQTPTNGSFDLQVSGKSVKSAASGTTVSVVAIPDEGYAVDTIKVTKVGDASTVTTVSNSTFVMPAYSAIVSVTFKQSKQSDITIDAATNGAVSVMVDNSSVTKAYAGAKVTVRTTPNSGFMLDNVRVTYNDYRDTIAVENGTFTMPNFPVTVTAQFKVDPDYNPASGSKIFTEVTNATITAKIGDKVVDSAKAGERVTLTVTPKEDYVLESIKVYYDNFKKTVALDKMSFTMPDEPVTVVAVVKPTADAEFALNIVENTEGTIKLTVDGKEVTSAKAGQTVKIEGSSSKAFYNYISYITKVGDSNVVVDVVQNDGTFVMPAFDVDVAVRFYIYRNIIIDNANSEYGSFATFSENGTHVTRCGAGVILNVNTWGVKDGYAAGNITITYDDGSTYTLTDTSSFVMPDCDIRIRVDFGQKLKLVAHPIIDSEGKSERKCGNTYSVLGVTLNDYSAAGYTTELWACYGKTITVTPSLVVGFELGDDAIYLSWTDADGKPQSRSAFWNFSTNQWQVQLPEKDEISSKNQRVELMVRVSEKESYAITANPTNETNKMGYVNFTTSLGTATKVAPGAIVWMRGEAYEGYNLDWSKVVIKNAKDNTVVTKAVNYDPTSATFTMPSYAVEVDFADAYADEVHTIKYSRIDSEYLDGESYIAKGKISVTIDGVTYDKFSGEDGIGTLLKDGAYMNVKAGTSVIVTHEALDGYTLEDIIVKTDPSNADVKFNYTSEYSGYFTMPFEDVVITPQYTDEYFSVNAAEAENGSFTVPANAKVNPGAEITNIKPDEGYDVKGVYASYTSGNGVEIDREEIKPDEATGKYVFVPSDGKLPQTAVTITVEFEPKEQKGTIIKYVFEDDEGLSVSYTSNYWVDLIVDGKTQDIERGSGKNWLEDKVADGSDLKTGKSVIIKRQESNMDTRFEIENIWVLYDGNTNAAEQYTNGQYWFTMPSVDKPCEIRVKYALKDNEKYAVKVTADGADVTINGKEVASGEYAYLTPGTYVSITATEWTGYDKDSLTVTVDGKKITAVGGEYSIGMNGTEYPVMSVPEDVIELVVKADKIPPTAYTVTDANPDDTTYAIEDEIGSDVSGKQVDFGSTVTIKAADKKMLDTVTVTTASDTAVEVAGGIYGKSFTMPKEDVTVTVTTKDAPVEANITVNNNDEENLDVKSVHGVYEGDKTYQGELVEIKASIKDEDAYDTYAAITVTVDGEKYDAISTYDNAPSTGDTTWQFAVPSGAKKVIVDVDYRYNKHNIVTTYSADSEMKSGVTFKCGDKTVQKVASGDTITLIAPTEGGKYGYGYKFADVTVKYATVAEYKDGNLETKIVELTLGKDKELAYKDGDEIGNVILELGKLKEGANVEITIKLASICDTDLPATATTTYAVDAPVDAGTSVAEESATPAVEVDSAAAEAEEGFLTIG